MDANNFPTYSTPVSSGKKVAVIGAGNTAMDVLRTAKRLGAEPTCYYRRSHDEAPARSEELKHAEQEAINWRWLSNPVEFIVDENNFVKQIKCERMELSEPDETGRRKPQSTGDFFLEDCDTVVMSLGCSVNPIIPFHRRRGPYQQVGRDCRRQRNVSDQQEGSLCSGRRNHRWLNSNTGYGPGQKSSHRYSQIPNGKSRGQIH